MPLSQVGEVMDGRYEVFASNGKGVFSSVVRARDMASRDEAGRNAEVSAGARGQRRGGAAGAQRCAQARGGCGRCRGRSS